jgi:hypothetical protein
MRRIVGEALADEGLLRLGRDELALDRGDVGLKLGELLGRQPPALQSGFALRNELADGFQVDRVHRERLDRCLRVALDLRQGNESSPQLFPAATTQVSESTKQSDLSVSTVD